MHRLGLVGVSPAHAGVEASPVPTRSPEACQPRVCGGGGEFVAEAITTRRRPVSVMVFLPERMYSDQVGGD